MATSRSLRCSGFQSTTRGRPPSLTSRHSLDCVGSPSAVLALGAVGRMALAALGPQPVASDNPNAMLATERATRAERILDGRGTYPRTELRCRGVSQAPR